MIKKIQSSMKSIWPEFHKHKQNTHLNSFYTFTDYWHLWTMSIFILAVTALAPLGIVTLIHYQLIQKSVDSELNLRTERLTSNAKRSVAFFMEERLNALIFTVDEMGYEQLINNEKLAEILKNVDEKKRADKIAKNKDASFYNGQIQTAQYFINTIIPKSMGMMDAVNNLDTAVIEISDTGFGGK